jgi:hypothetical protein
MADDEFKVTDGGTIGIWTAPNPPPSQGTFMWLKTKKGFPPTDDHIKQILIVVDGPKIAERHKGKWESLNPNYSVTDDLYGEASQPRNRSARFREAESLTGTLDGLDVGLNGPPCPTEALRRLGET